MLNDLEQQRLPLDVLFVYLRFEQRIHKFINSYITLCLYKNDLTVAA